MTEPTAPKMNELSITLRYRVPDTEAGRRFFNTVPDIAGQCSFIAGAEWYGGEITTEPFHIFELEAKALADAEAWLECQFESDHSACRETYDALETALLNLRAARRALAASLEAPTDE